MNETRPTRCPCCGELIPECVAHEVEVGVVYSCPACRQPVHAIPGAADESAHFISEEDREALRSLRAAKGEEREERMRRLPLVGGLQSDADGRVVGLFRDLVDR